MIRSTTAALALGAALGGCAITSSHHTGPNGRPVHFIDGTSAGAAYSKAQQLCPQGYNLVGEPRMVSVMDYVMTIECKSRSTPVAVPSPALAPVAIPTAAPVLAATAAPAQRAPGKFEYTARERARENTCAAQPTPQLLSAAPGVETYTVACDNGGVAVMRCDMGGCREMR